MPTQPYIGEISITSFNFAPKGWALCNGQLLPLSGSNLALFSLLGTYYGGNGSTNFALPDFRGRIPVHFTPAVPIGLRQGEEGHTLIPSELPQHFHGVKASNTNADSPIPNAHVLAPALNAYRNPDSLTILHPNTIAVAGGGQPHNNMAPYTTMQFIIALQGIFPSRN